MLGFSGGLGLYFFVRSVTNTEVTNTEIDHDGGERNCERMIKNVSDFDSCRNA